MSKPATRTAAEPGAAEHKQRSSLALRRPVWSPTALVDQGFFIFAGVASFWFVWLVWREGWHTGGWWLVGFFAVVWVITAYFALPRLHRILSSIYVPNYFIGRTRTPDGLLGDPVNLAFRGSEAQLHRAMTAAGWVLADDVTVRSSWRIILATLTRRSYPNAPVSPLVLFGRQQDFAYQQEIDGNPGKRHHVRFWRCPQGWLLPGGHQVDWLAAGTYDKSVGLSIFTLQVTHKIDENTDIERDYVVKTVTRALRSIELTVLEDFSTGYHSRNGGGDNIITDGDLPVIELGRVRAKASEDEDAPSDLILDATTHETMPDEHATLMSQFLSRRPPQIALGIIMIGLAIAVATMSTFFEILNFSHLRMEVVRIFHESGLPLQSIESATHIVATISAIVSTTWIGIVIFLAGLTFRGSDRSRILLMSIASLAAVISSFGLTIGRVTWSAAGTLLFIGVNIVIVLMFSTDAARRFTRARSGK